MTFKATLKEASLLIDPLASIADLIDEGVFKITSSGISLAASDRAMVAVVDFNLSKSAFESFELDSDQSIGLSIANTLSVLKRASGKDVLKLSLDGNKLEIEIVGGSKRKFVVPIIDIKQDEIPQIDQLTFPAKVELKSDILLSGIADAEIISDAVLFQVSSDKFVIKAEGDVSSSELELEKDSPGLISIQSESEANSKYPIDYLKRMIKAAKIADTVTVEFGKDYPMKLSFKSGEDASLKFVLAPRVSDSD